MDDIRTKGGAPINDREKFTAEEAEADAADAGARKGPVGDAADKLSPEVKNLIEEGKKRGFVTYDELNKVLPDDMVSPDKLDTILQMMDDLGIEMVETAAEGGEAKEGAGFEPDDDEREFEQPEEVETKTRGVASEKIDDPVRMYLTQMGEIPLLSREDELRLAKRIEITRKRFRTKVLESPFAVVEAIRILEDVKNGDAAFERTLKADSSIDFPKMDVLERLPAIIDKLRQTLFDSHECFDKLSKRALSSKERQRTRRRLRERPSSFSIIGLIFLVWMFIPSSIPTQRR